MLEFNATFFVAMFSFIVFMLMMNSILYKPLSKIVEQRDGIINGNYSDAELTNQKIDDLANQHKESIETAKTLAKEQFNQKIGNYKSQKDAILESAKMLAKKDLAIAQTELAGEEKSAKIVLESKVLDLASQIASKLLSEDVKITESKSEKLL